MFALRWVVGWLGKFFPNLFKSLNGWLVAFITPLIAPFFAFVSSFFRKVALYSLIITAIGVAIAAFASAIDNGVSFALSQTAPDVIDFGRAFLPGNLSQGIVVLLFARLNSLIFMWVHRLTERFIHT